MFLQRLALWNQTYTRRRLSNVENKTGHILDNNIRYRTCVNFCKYFFLKRLVVPIFNNHLNEFQGSADHIHNQTCAKSTSLSQRLCVSSWCPSYRLDNRSCCCCALADIFHTSFDREKAKINERIASRGFKIIF